MRSRGVSLAVWLVIAGCASGVKTPAGKGVSRGSSSCGSSAAPVEIDLAAIDAKSLHQIDALRREGLVAVALRPAECGFEIEVISSCFAKGLYQYSAQQKRDRHVVASLASLQSLLPVGAARLANQLTDRRELVVESATVGSLRFSGGAHEFFASDLRGSRADCDRVTHMITAIDVGEIGVLSGTPGSIERASAIGASVLAAGVTRVVHEGDPRACDRASRDSLETEGCTTPAHISLLAVGDRSRALPVEVVSVTPPQPSAVPTPPPAVTADPRPPIPPGMRISVQHLVVMHAGSMRGNSTVKRSREQAQLRAEEALRKIRSGEDFGKIVRQFTDEPLRGSRPGAADQTGVLDDIHGGMTVARFENIAFFLGVGEISDVVETEFGFHIIKRLR